MWLVIVMLVTSFWNNSVFFVFQSEVQLKGEVAVRNQLLHAMAEQQNLMDALTAVSKYSMTLCSSCPVLTLCVCVC